MRKLLLMIAIVACSAVTFAQADTPETTKVSTEINNVVNNIFDKTTEAVKGIGEALKVPAEHVYTVLVKQQVITSIANTFALLLAFIFAIVAYKVMMYGYSKPKPDDYHNRFYYSEALIPACVFPALFSLVGFIYFVATLSDTLTGYINPEYGAMKEIIKFLN
jgi:hypothetical protein